jgi:hypothetical protein
VRQNRITTEMAESRSSNPAELKRLMQLGGAENVDLGMAAV